MSSKFSCDTRYLSQQAFAHISIKHSVEDDYACFWEPMNIKDWPVYANPPWYINNTSFMSAYAGCTLDYFFFCLKSCKMSCCGLFTVMQVFAAWKNVLLILWLNTTDLLPVQTRKLQFINLSASVLNCVYVRAQISCKISFCNCDDRSCSLRHLVGFLWSWCESHKLFRWVWACAKVVIRCVSVRSDYALLKVMENKKKSSDWIEVSG